MVTSQRVHDEPAVCEVRGDAVREVKPDGTPVDMTPEAAIATAAALLDAAAVCDGRKKLADEAATRKARQG